MQIFKRFHLNVTFWIKFEVSQELLISSTLCFSNFLSRMVSKNRFMRINSRVLFYKIIAPYRVIVSRKTHDFFLFSIETELQSNSVIRFAPSINYICNTYIYSHLHSVNIYQYSIDIYRCFQGINDSLELPKPKRISRVESLRNLFRSSERGSSFLNGDVSARNVTIQEEDVTCIGHYPMEKALSEGAIKNVSLGISSDDSQVDRGSLLREKKKQLSRSIHDLQEQQRVLDYILNNQDVLKTQEGTALARETLNKVRRSTSPKLRTSQAATTDRGKSNVSVQTRDFISNQLSNIKKNLFNTQRASGGDCDRWESSFAFVSSWFCKRLKRDDVQMNVVTKQRGLAVVSI